MTQIQSAEQIQNSLPYFTGSEQFYEHPLFQKFIYTDGVKYIADAASAYWLLDHIVISQIQKKFSQHEFQVWRLVVHDNGSATLTTTDGNGGFIYSYEIPYTDFPLPEISFFLTNNTLLLPSEY